MSAPDFYHDWLRIPPGPRPPTHYALLGLDPFEGDEAKIRGAAAERIKQIRNYALKFPHESTKLLNEVAAAEVCLTHAESRAEYENRLRGAELSLPSVPSAPPAPATPTVHARAADDKTTYDFLPTNEPEKRSGATGSPPRDKPDKARPPSGPDGKVAADNDDEEPAGPAERPLVTPARIGAAAAAVVVLVLGAAIVSSIYQGSRHPRMPIAGTGTSDRPEVKTATWSKGPPSATPAPLSVAPEPTPVTPPMQAVPPPLVPNPPPGQATSIVVPSPSAPVGLPVALLNGNLDRNDFIIDSDTPSLGGLGRCKNYLVELRPGKTYAIELSRSSQDVWDPYLEVQDIAGRTLASDDNSGGVLDARLLFTPTAAATTYRIVAASHSRVGTYVLTVREQPDAKRGKLPSNVLAPARDPVTVKDALQITHRRDELSGGHSLVYGVFLRENRVYRFRITAVAPQTKLQPYLRLNDPEIRPVQSAMNQQGGPAEFVHSASRTGIYEIVVSTLTDTGPFELTIIDQGHPSAQGPDGFMVGPAVAAVRPGMAMPAAPGGLAVPPAFVRNLPVQQLKGGSFRTVGAVGNFNRDGKSTDEFAFHFDAATTYTIDVGTNQFQHETQVFTEDGKPVNVTVGKVPGLAPKPGVVSHRTTVVPQADGVHHVVVAWVGPPVIRPPGIANNRFEIHIKRGPAAAKASEPTLPPQTVELVRDTAKVDDRLKAGEDKRFLFKYEAFRVLTAEVKSDDFEPILSLTLNDGRPVDGNFKEDGSRGRLVYRGTKAGFVRLRVSSSDGSAGPFTLRLKLD